MRSKSHVVLLPLLMWIIYILGVEKIGQYYRGVTWIWYFSNQYFFFGLPLLSVVLYAGAIGQKCGFWKCLLYNFIFLHLAFSFLDCLPMLLDRCETTYAEILEDMGRVILHSLRYSMPLAIIFSPLHFASPILRHRKLRPS
jgi:hypothetical protein